MATLGFEKLMSSGTSKSRRSAVERNRSCVAHGVVFELDAGGNFSVLHTFEGGDGASPDSILRFDAAGNLYGTTIYGGSSNTCQRGCGTVFKLAPNGNGTWTESVLHSFCSLDGCKDGWYPGEGPLVIDAAGSLYGVAGLGGANQCFQGGGCGLVYRLDAGGHETVLYNFAGGKDGAGPAAGVV